MSAASSPLWALPASRQPDTALWRFALQAGVAPDDYDALHAWSLAQPEAFHALLWDFLDIIGDKPGAAYAGGDDFLSARFYPGARLNYAENLLRDADDRPAIIAHGDTGQRRTLSRRELAAEVSRCEQALRDRGVTTGDRVAAIITNDIEAIVGYLATAAIGAIWCSCSPDFGPTAAVDRLGQVSPKVLIAKPAYQYGGKHLDISATIRAVAEHGHPEQVVLVSDTIPDTLADLPCVPWQTLLASHAPGPIRFTRLPYDAPLAILFSSGTTGKPKGIVHSAMGLLLQHKKELILHGDLRPGERFFYFTTCGWMMWNWQVSGLAVGATLVTFDGNPFHPAPDYLPDLIAQEQINVFGTSAKYLAACEQAGLAPANSHDLSSLRLVLSTGSPLLPESFDYVYRDWKADVHLASISGGTDICGCFLGGNPLLPVHRGELQCRLLGMAVDVYDADGKPLPEGRSGELVCTRPHLSVPLGFWDDVDGSRFQSAYFSRFPGIWAHGDYVEKRPGGGYVIHGRSDTTLNPGGVRIGTAEIYRQVETLAVIEEAVAVGQDWQGDQRIILFVRLAPGITLDAALTDTIKQRIRSGATPRHVPAKILAVSDIPRTRSGKISEVAVRDTIHGRPLANTAALANPGCLEAFRDLNALKP